jgi:hypothetical protein
MHRHSPSGGLIGELDRLLRLAGTDEYAAIAAFDHLSVLFPREEIAAALTVVMARYVGTGAIGVPTSSANSPADLAARGPIRRSRPAVR